MSLKRIKTFMYGMVAGSAGIRIFEQPRMCEQEAAGIATHYHKADAAWVRGLVARAYDVASHRTPYSHEHYTALSILRDLHWQILSQPVWPSFRTPEEMIPE